MTINYDTNNAYLGDVLYGNHSIDYPNINYLKAYDIFTMGVNKINEDISAMMTALNIPHNITGTYGSNSWRINWSSPTDETRPAAERFSIGFNGTNGVLNGRNDANEVVLGSSTAANFLSSILTSANQNPYFRPYMVVNLSRQHLSIYIRAMKGSTENDFIDSFLHSSYLQNVNPSYNYYTEKQIYSCFVCGKGTNGSWLGYHYREPNNKGVLTTGEANYPIVCADRQAAELNWLTDWYIFDNNPILGNPAIGRVPNMLVSPTSYTSGRPVKLLGTVLPDTNNNKWLPIGNWMGKTIFMRIFSSFTAS